MRKGVRKEMQRGRAKAAVAIAVEGGQWMAEVRFADGRNEVALLPEERLATRSRWEYNIRTLIFSNNYGRGKLLLSEFGQW